MPQKILIRKIRSPAPGSLDEDIDYLCKSLGYYSKRDRQYTAGKIFRLLVKEACEPDNCLSSDEIAEKLNLTRGAIVHHLNSFISAGIVVKEHNRYRLRSVSLQKSMEEIRADIDRIMEQMIKIAVEIDEKLGHYYR
jgi:DNA-binding MarR family transcriptional regulator